MLNAMQSLSQEEKDLLLEALPLVTVLIAGADGKIDVSETSWAEKLTGIRSYSNAKEATKSISDKLAGLNDILPKLPQVMAAKLYKSLTSFAKHIARADGGVFKMWSVSKEEQALIDLPMITPVEMPEEA